MNGATTIVVGPLMLAFTGVDPHSTVARIDSTIRDADELRAVLDELTVIERTVLFALCRTVAEVLAP